MMTKNDQKWPESEQKLTEPLLKMTVSKSKLIKEWSEVKEVTVSWRDQNRRKNYRMWPEIAKNRNNIKYERKKTNATVTWKKLTISDRNVWKWPKNYRKKLEVTDVDQILTGNWPQKTKNLPVIDRNLPKLTKKSQKTDKRW